MSRTAITYTILPGNSVVNLQAATNVDVTNGHSIAIPKVSSPGATDSADHLFLYVTNGDGSDRTLTVKGNGGSTLSFRGGTAGTDLAVTISHTAGGGLVGPLEVARFAQIDGSVNIDIDASWTTGTIRAFMLPARW